MAPDRKWAAWQAMPPLGAGSAVLHTLLSVTEWVYPLSPLPPAPLPTLSPHPTPPRPTLRRSPGHAHTQAACHHPLSSQTGPDKPHPPTFVFFPLPGPARPRPVCAPLRAAACVCFNIGLCGSAEFPPQRHPSQDGGCCFLAVAPLAVRVRCRVSNGPGPDAPTPHPQVRSGCGPGTACLPLPHSWVFGLIFLGLGFQRHACVVGATGSGGWVQPCGEPRANRLHKWRLGKPLGPPCC